jgi:hypothetical protein
MPSCYAGPMARDESAREDLLREATALVERIELSVAGAGDGNEESQCKVVIGFRANGSMSVFFGDDLAYQFNAAGELRRAYCEGQLFKADRGRLVSLDRQRQQGVVQLLSRDLSDAEQTSFVNTMQDCLRRLSDGLEHGAYSVAGQFPAESDVLSRVRRWLTTHDGLPIAATPRV